MTPVNARWIFPIMGTLAFVYNDATQQLKVIGIQGFGDAWQFVLYTVPDAANE